MENAAEWSWAADVVYSCVCGACFAAQRWRWVDAEAQPQLAQMIRRSGPIMGQCPACRRPAEGQGAWLELHPAAEGAELLLGPQQRGEIVASLKRHLQDLEERPDFARAWLLQPVITFLGVEGRPPAEDTVPNAVLPVAPAAPVPARVTPIPAAIPAPLPAAKSAPMAAAAPAPAPPFRPPPGPVEIQRAANGELDVIDGVIVVRLHLDDATARAWATAPIEARPIHFRDLGYPLLGVRVVATMDGGDAVIDGLIDVGDVEAHESFARLAEAFRLDLVIHGARGSTALRRELVSPGLERNAALCLESASALLAGSEFAPDAFLQASERLDGMSSVDRLRRAEVPLEIGAYEDLRTAVATAEAVDHLDHASGRENLTHLLEVDGLPLAEYESIRKHVLSAAVEYGICPPSRFWRRILIPEVGENAQAIVGRLARTRGAEVGGELPPELASENWYRLRELCDRKRVRYPAELQGALDDGGGRPLGRRRSQQPPMVASGEIGGPSPAPAPPAASASSSSLGRSRLAKATELIESGPTPEQVIHVIRAMEEFDDHEILAILPALSELGPIAVPALVEQLRSGRREIRQSAAILLGLARDGRAVEPLCHALLGESTNVWRDIARALGNYGPRVVGSLCELVRHVDAPSRDRAITRVARAMAEVILSDGNTRGGPGRHAVEALVDVQDPSISSAATRALATLGDVSSAGEEIRGERPLAEDTAVRGFARRAYEAITTPELDIVVEEDVEEVEVG
ncbi:MAG: hypothetical protein R3B09_34940 [Nannocystaceae bacterium]